MDDTNDIKRIRVIYFSGSGGTKRIAEAFLKELEDRGAEVFVNNLGATLQERMNASAEQVPRDADLNILIYAVHAMDAPKPVYNWIESTSGDEAGRKIAVISVSGGGEMWPNKGCRNNCCKALERRGFQIVYDRMMCMPSNVLVSYNDHLVMRLINAIPKKVSVIVDALLAGETHQTHFGKGPILDWVSRSEREHTGKYAQGFKISDECTGCGWCAQSCPTENITISEASARPEFLDRCVICTRCVYGCPSHAIKAKGPVALKNGFDLNEVEARMQSVELEPLDQCCKGWIYKGVKDYLLDKY